MNKRSLFLVVLLSCVLFFSSNTFAAALTANHDLNVDVVKVGGTYLSPGIETFTIVWWYRDVNFLTATHDVNVEFSISQNSTDDNLMLTAVSDRNAVTYCGGGGDVNFGGITRCTYSWSTTAPLIDGNYLIDVNMFTYASGALDDMNRIRKNSDANFTLDQNSPTITITSPTSSDSLNYTLSYSATDAGSFIARYWVSDDNVNYILNGTNTSYSFSVPSGTPSKNFYVKSSDIADNNSPVGMVTVTYNIGGGGGSPVAPVCGDGSCIGSENSVNCPLDCSSICGDGTCTNEENYETCPNDCLEPKVCGDDYCASSESNSTCPQDCEAESTESEIIFETSKSFSSSNTEVENALKEAGFNENDVQEAQLALEKTDIRREIAVQDSQGTFNTFISLVVTNDSDNAITDVKVFEVIPKSIAETAQEIESNYEFEVLEEDPVLIFTIDSLQPGESQEINYSLQKNVSSDSFDEYTAPIVLSLEESTAQSCALINCDDYNPCTTDSCTSGQCQYIALPDGSACGFGKQCQAGSCINVPTQDNTVVQQKDDSVLFIGIVLIVIAALAGYFYYNRRK